MSMHHFLAFDLGASSGRAILGTLKDQQSLELLEIHRFNNQMLRIHGHDYWNVFSLFDELKKSLKICIREHGIQPESIAIDTWGVDFGLLDRSGNIIGIPFAYRDCRTNNAMEDFFKLMPKEKLYGLTGIQFMQFNSLFQISSMVHDKSPQLEIADNLLFTPDLLSYLFCGVKKTEFSIASTSQLLRPGTNQWEEKLFDVLGLPTSLMNEVVWPGTILGNLTEEICEETGSKPIPVVAVASHDTASAIAAVPAEGKNWAYLSSGTWSLMGIESEKPHISPKSYELAFTNEGGVDGTIRFLKNITGLWLLQECRKVWVLEKEYSFPELVELSQTAPAFKSLIDPDDALFMNPENMPEAIAEYCRRSNQPVPTTIAETVRCIFESLALKYKLTLKQIEAVTNEKIEKLHIIGGGANNKFLNQLTANALGIPVIAGPGEATAIGNLLMQARALGCVDSLSEIRSIVRNSVELLEFIPQNSSEWDEPFCRRNG
ncbi:MAG: rhamnulokinase family protein [Bacteroidota bacterium]|nr:rhamnulokinase family protein [Bacteroidota bacterium]